MKRITCLIFLMILISSSVYCQTAQEYINIGNTKLNLQDYEGALADFTKAIKIDPKNAMAYYSSGLARTGLEDLLGCT